MTLIVFRVSRSPIQTSEVLSLLLEPPADSISTLPPVNPKGGGIYIYHSKAEKKGMAIGGLREGHSFLTKSSQWNRLLLKLLL